MWLVVHRPAFTQILIRTLPSLTITMHRPILALLFLGLIAGAFAGTTSTLPTLMQPMSCGAISKIIVI
jgi:hypothetical protein